MSDYDTSFEVALVIVAALLAIGMAGVAVGMRAYLWLGNDLVGLVLGLFIAIALVTGFAHAIVRTPEWRNRP